MVEWLWSSTQRHTDGFVFLKAIRNCFCNLGMHYDPVTCCGFVGQMRVYILSRILRLNSQNWCVSRENIRKCSLVTHLGRFSNNPRLPLYLRPILSPTPSDTMGSSTLKWGATLDEHYHPSCVRMFGVMVHSVTSNSQVWVIYHHQKVFPTHTMCLTCSTLSRKFYRLVPAPGEYVPLGFLFYALFWNVRITSAPFMAYN